VAAQMSNVSLSRVLHPLVTAAPQARQSCVSSIYRARQSGQQTCMYS